MFSLNYRDPRPIYEQIKENFKRLIVTGVLSPDDKLPSVRDLASQLAINPNTIQRAYCELESEGVIYTLAGKGSFAAQQKVDDLKISQLLRDFEKLVEQLMLMGVHSDALIARIPVKGETTNDRT